MPKVAYLAVRAFVGRVLAAAVVGTATLLLMKPNPTMHWSIPPAIAITSHHATTAEQLRRFGLRIRLRALTT
jgi:hypothetical protein